MLRAGCASASASSGPASSSTCLRAGTTPSSTCDLATRSAEMCREMCRDVISPPDQPRCAPRCAEMYARCRPTPSVTDLSCALSRPASPILTSPCLASQVELSCAISHGLITPATLPTAWAHLRTRWPGFALSLRELLQQARTQPRPAEISRDQPKSAEISRDPHMSRWNRRGPSWRSRCRQSSTV